MKRTLLYLLIALCPIFSWAQINPNNNNQLADSLNWEQSLAQGRYYREHGNSFRAMKFLQRADSLHSNDTIRRELASCLFVRGEYKQCIALCQSLLEPDSLEQDLYLMARCYEKLEMTPEAFQYQMMVANRNIENYNNLLSLCQTLIGNKQYEDAITMLNRYCEIDSTNAAVNTVKAYALHNANRFDEAIDLYEKLVAEGDNRASTLYYLGLSYYRRKNFGEAYDLLKQAVEKSGRDNANILSRFGVVELNIKRENITWAKNHRPVLDSLSILNLFSLDCKDIVAEYKKSDTICNEINQRGIADITEAIEKMYPDPETIYYLQNSIANMYFWKGEDKKAIEYFKQCLETSSKHYNVYYNMAISYQKLKDYGNEKTCFEKFLEMAASDEDPDALQYAKDCIEECKKMLFMKKEK